MSAVVRSGYKRTEVGIIPKDWNVVTVADEFSIQLGKMLDSEKNVGILRPYLGNRAIQWGRVDLADLGEVRMTPSDIQRFRLREGDLLVCEGGEIGRAAIWKQPIQECYYQKALHRLRPKRGYNTSLMLNILQRWASTGVLLNFATQTSIAHLPKDKFEKIPLLQPPTKAEQEAIAKALNDADALIESLEQLITKKCQIKQGAMRVLLTGKKRLPGFNGDWEVKRLGDLADIQRGASPRPIDDPIWFDESSAIGWVRISDVTRSGKYLKETVQRLSPLGVRQSRPVDQGNLIMSICATVGRPVITEIAVCIHDGFVVFDNLQSDKHFMYHVLKSIENDWSKHGQTGSQMNLNTGLINGTSVAVPCLAEQIAIASILSDMDIEIAELVAEVAKVRNIKQGMMKKLLTGEIRLI